MRLVTLRAMRWTTSTRIFLVMLVALAIVAVRMLARECSGYACVAHAIAWILWFAFYLPVLALGHLCRPRLPAESHLQRPLRLGLLTCWLMPPLLAAFWLLEATRWVG
ncbi:hypothetical protein ACFONG_11140 [Uliginosibacterium paludis]|uniref:Transmembrane protein n=1 Tax=Uliginosibacterium paludis TaxID=1615952 RepID=A0ABV2CM47_9RHOO